MKIKIHKNLKEIVRSKTKLYATTVDNKLKVFDLRNYFKPMQEIQTYYTDKIAVSTNDVVGLAMGSELAVLTRNNSEIEQLIHVNSDIGSICFNPFEDIVTATTRNKYESFVTPNSSDTKYNADVISPYMTKNEKREVEVKKLLEKIPPEMISYNSACIKNRHSKVTRPLKREL